MTIAQEMLRAAARAKPLLGDPADRTAAFLRSRLREDGGFADRSGKSDLYYTVFALTGLAALDGGTPRDEVAAYLRSFGDDAGLDMLHLACLARCWACLAPDEAPPGLRGEVLRRLASCRTGDGGYALRAGAEGGSAYGCFVALGALQDVGADPPEPEGIATCLNSLRTGDGGFANDAGLPFGAVPAAAAAVAALHHLGRPAGPETARWLLAQHRQGGGFAAVAPAPEADLLSTATALHALALLGADPSPVRPACLRFVRSLARTGGGFAGHAGDPTPDCEYTFYALLALGRLAT